MAGAPAGPPPGRAVGQGVGLQLTPSAPGKMTYEEFLAWADPGFRLQVEWLWQEPLPPELEVLRQGGVV